MEDMNCQERRTTFTSEYPGYTMANLETRGVHGHLYDPNKVLVRSDHPAVVLMILNREILGQDITAQAPIDEDWYEVQRGILASCCASIRVLILGLRSPLMADKYDTVIKTKDP